MRAVSVLVALSFAIAACSDGGGDGGSFRGFVDSYTTQLEQAQYGRMWEFLHPAQQDEITMAEYEQCMRSEFGEERLSIDDVDIVETEQERITIPGTDEQVDSTAVTWSATFSAGGESQETRETMHLVEIDDKWRWFMADLDQCS